MHLLAAQPGGYVEDDGVVVRLAQDPGDIVVLSAADTTLALLAQHCPHGDYPSVRLANWLHLRQPAAVDLYVEEVLQHARVIVIDHLGGERYWPYGTERVIELAHAHGIALAMFSGDESEDLNLLRKSTVAEQDARTLWRYLREGGAHNARQFFCFIGARYFGHLQQPEPPRPLPKFAIFHPHSELGSLDAWRAQWQPGAPCVLVVFYRAHLQAGNTAVFAELCAALQARGLNPLPVALASLKDAACVQALQALAAAHRVALVLNTTAFARSALDEPDGGALAGDAPVLQVILAGTNEATWRADMRGLAPRDIAMHVALPEVDGRIITRAVSFKDLDHRCARTQCDVVRYRAEPERLAFVAELAARWCRLRTRPHADKRIALVLANYPARDSRIGNGVGLDTPASVVHILRRLAAEGYTVADIPADGDALMAALRQGVTNDPDMRALRPAWQSLALGDYLAFFERLPEDHRAALVARWGPPEADPMLRQGRFMIAGLRCGHVFIGIQPSRGEALASAHDPDTVPPHHYVAFYLWLREVWLADAVAHVGKHGSLEWLPGKSVALSQQCWPDLVFGPLPHLYPFIVNDPGEGTQAKRRAQAVIIDHLTPPLTRAESHGPLRDLERLVDEYYEAVPLDSERAGLLRRQILELIVRHDLHRDLGLSAPASAEEEQRLLQRIDAYLCELKEAQIRDGLHIFGISPTGRLRRDTLLALVRHPVGDGRGARLGLTQALAADLGLGEGFDALHADWSAPWQGPRPHLLVVQDSSPWRTVGDTRERLEALALAVLEQGVPTTAETDWQHTRAVLARIQTDVAPRLDACGQEEMHHLMRGLAGRFVPAGASGAPTRGRPDVLPTGRNFYSIDTRAVPTPTSWALGLRAAERLIERYLQEHGDYPRAIGMSVWGTATMRTGGDDIAQALALMGVRPKWADGSHRVHDFEILPAAILGRPRVDVTLRVSGLFRDAFANVIRLFDAAVQAVAALDEPEDVNPIRARIAHETTVWVARGLPLQRARRMASFRAFGAKPQSYGTGLQGLLHGSHWDTDADLARAYLAGSGYAYGQGEDGVEAGDALAQRLAGLEVVLHNQDNREHDVLDSDDYWQYQGGMAAAVRHLAGHQPALYFGDHSNPAAPVVRTLAEEISRVVRSRVTNPKWIAGVKRHGYKGAAEMAATVDYLFAFGATAGVVRDDQYARVADAFLEDPDTRDFLLRHNPQALLDIGQRLLEAMRRGLWAAPGDYRARVEDHLLAAEQYWEQG